MLKASDSLSILLLALVWSPTFLVIRMGIHEIQPITLTFLRCLSAFSILYIWSKIRGVSYRGYFRQWKTILLAALLVNAIPFTLCAFGETTADSSTAGIIDGSVPLFVLLFSYFFLKSRDLKRNQIISIGLGFAGLVVIFAPTLGRAGGTSIGIVLLVFMAIFFAMGFLYTERKINHIPSLDSTVLQMGFSAIALLPLALIWERPWQGELPSLTMVLGVVALGAFITALGWLLYFFLIKKVKVTYVSVAALLQPGFCIFWGWIVLKEELYWYKLLGAGIILFSMLMMGESWVQFTKRIKARFIPGSVRSIENKEEEPDEKPYPNDKK